MAGRNISLTDQLARFVDRQVKTGRHQSASEVVREALRRYESELAAEQACVAMIRELARDGRSAIARGDYSLIDGAEARDALFRRVTGRRLAAKPKSRRG
jgi:antitoxin ParD1/3/4